MRGSGILCVQVNDVRLKNASCRYCRKTLEQSYYVRAISSRAVYCDFECYCCRTEQRAA